MGKLIKATGTPGTTYLNVSHQTKFCYVVNQAGWSLRGQRSQSFHSLHVHILQELVPSLTMGNDVVLSKHGENDYHTSFSAAKTWDKIKPKRTRAGWNYVLWFPQRVPHFSFVTVILP